MRSVRGSLEGKVAIVTGAGTADPADSRRSIGRTIAVAMARAGARVAVLDIATDRAQTTLNEIDGEGGTAIAITADVSRAADCVRALEIVTTEYGRLDVMVNSAALLLVGSAVEVDEEQWDRVIAVNLKGTMLMTKYAVPAMANSGGGSIINISTSAAVRGFGVSAYAASKGGIEALTIDTAVAYGRKGIRANVIVPGYIDTPMSGRADARGSHLKRESTPLGTTGTAWDVAWAAQFLAGDDARWITGAVLPVDAGLMRVTPLVMLHHLMEAHDGAVGAKAGA
jgi:NAD(P)-dependent dehydrogenase (short-subunit alcohol dehydrogenase family)